jgi:hypothetical protein
MQISHSLIAAILKALTAFPAVFKALTALTTILKPLATILEALAAFLALTAYKTLAVSATIAALIETGTVPAVEVEAQSDFFDRVIPFES